MGPHRNCKQKLQTKQSNNRTKAPDSTSNMKKKELDCAREKVETNSKETIESRKVPSKNISIFKYLNNISNGDCFSSSMKKFRKTCIVNHFLESQVCTTICPFERRVTAIEWHPKYPKFFAAGSKGGELTLVNYTVQNNSRYISGIGPGGSIVGLKFSLEDDCSVYTASITGKIRQEHFYNGIGKTLMSTYSFRNWFSALDVCQDKKLILAGDTIGNVYLLNIINGEKIWPERKRLHKDKVTHAEFCKLDPNIFVTASLDYSVKLWDLRMLSSSNGKSSPMCTFPHLKGVNSAVFSPSNRHSLLTTDQLSQLRVYKSPGWTEELIIPHPHRFFQHLTPIKANWHPLEDIIVVGRYPHEEFMKNDTRTLDFYDGSNGDLLSKMKSTTGGILSLNAFNRTGDCLASTAGNSIVLTTRKNVFASVNFWERSNLTENFVSLQ